ENYLAWPTNALGGGGTLTNAVIQGDTVVAGRIASTPGGRGAVYDAIDRIAHAETRNIDFDAVYTPNERWRMHFKAGYTDAEGDTYAQPFVEFGAPATFDYDLRGSAPQVHFLNLDPTNPSQMVFDFASMHEVTNKDKETYAYYDVTRNVNLGALTAIQGGLKWADHQRDTGFNATTFGGFSLPLQASGCGGPCTPSSFADGLTPGDFLDNVAAPGTLTSYWQVDRGKVEQFLMNFPGVTANRIPNP